MPVLFGIVIGVLLTVASAMTYDTMTGRVDNGLSPTAAGAPPPIVNWSVVDAHWQNFQSDMREVEAGLERGWKKLTS
jgi:hypothetical protein